MIFYSVFFYMFSNLWVFIFLCNWKWTVLREEKKTVRALVNMMEWKYLYFHSKKNLLKLLWGFYKCVQIIYYSSQLRHGDRCLLPWIWADVSDSLVTNGMHQESCWVIPRLGHKITTQMPFYDPPHLHITQVFNRWVASSHWVFQLSSKIF